MCAVNVLCVVPTLSVSVAVTRVFFLTPCYVSVCLTALQITLLITKFTALYIYAYLQILLVQHQNKNY